MKIGAISTAENYYTKYQPVRAVNYTSNSVSTTYNPSFKSITGLFLKVATFSFFGKAVKNYQQLNIKKNLMQNYVDIVLHKNKEKSPAGLLLSLSKLPSLKEPDGLLDMYYQYNDKFPSLKSMRDCAMKDIFPLIKEMPNDMNQAVQAKISFLESMLESGEYIDSSYFYKTFRDLPPVYEKNKAVLLEKIMNNPFYAQNFSNFCKKTGNSNSFKSEEYLKSLLKFAVSTLSSSISEARNPDFFIIYRDKLASYKAEADKAIRNILGINGKTNEFYNTYSAGLIKGIRSVYKQVYADMYYYNNISRFLNDKEGGMKFFNVSEKYFDDMVKDYNSIYAASRSNDDQTVKQIFAERITDKLKSDDEKIIKSAVGFLDLSGFGKHADESVINDKTLLGELKGRVAEAPKYDYNTDYPGNYRYDDDISYLGIKDIDKTLQEMQLKEDKHAEFRHDLSESMWQAAQAL